MPKVKLLTDIDINTDEKTVEMEHHKKGDVVTFPDKIAKDLVALEVAEEVKPKK